MSNAGYREAIRWLAYNDDPYFAYDDDAPLSVAATMVADLYRKDTETVRRDVRSRIEKGA